jgi:hypothetical protein
VGSFADEISRFEAKTLAKMDLAARKLSLEVFSKVILRSPVDTGRFRGNWQVAIGSVPDGTIELDDASGTATVSKAQATTARMKAGDVIYLANNLPYAMKLEEGGYPDGPKVENGRSSQAPNGMVALTAQEFQGIVAALNAELGQL